MTKLIRQTAEHGLYREFAEIENPEGIFPAFELVPLAAPLSELTEIKALVCDMDGTSTTTEELCIHSLETMIRRISGLSSKEQWEGLKDTDHPHIIGNSTTKHVEYLLQTYSRLIDPMAFRSAYLQAVSWFVHQGPDPKRREEVIRSFLQSLSLDPKRRQEALKILSSPHISDTGNLHNTFLPELKALSEFLPPDPTADSAFLLRGAVDVYYQRYHEILSALKAGLKPPDMDGLNSDILIRPMPGLILLLPLLKGIFSPFPEASLAFARSCFPERNIDADRWSRLLQIFGARPARMALVTSSIRYEADIVMEQVFSELRNSALAAEPSLREVLMTFFSPPVLSTMPSSPPMTPMRSVSNPIGISTVLPSRTYTCLLQILTVSSAWRTAKAVSSPSVPPVSVSPPPCPSPRP